MAEKNSPLPWKITFGGRPEDDYVVVGDRDGNPVFDCSLANYRGQLTHEQMMANVNLIIDAGNRILSNEVILATMDWNMDEQA